MTYASMHGVIALTKTAVRNSDSRPPGFSGSSEPVHRGADTHMTAEVFYNSDVGVGLLGLPVAKCAS